MNIEYDIKDNHLRIAAEINGQLFLADTPITPDSDLTDLRTKLKNKVIKMSNDVLTTRAEIREFDLDFSASLDVLTTCAIMRESKTETVNRIIERLKSLEEWHFSKHSPFDSQIAYNHTKRALEWVLYNNEVIKNV